MAKDSDDGYSAKEAAERFVAACALTSYRPQANDGYSKKASREKGYSEEETPQVTGCHWLQCSKTTA